VRSEDLPRHDSLAVHRASSSTGPPEGGALNKRWLDESP
jgi:hypothetical protein